jgi:hypothetical protein
MHAQVIRQDRFGEPRDAFRPEVVPFDGIPDAHQRMGDGVEVFGNRVALVGAPAPGLGAT